MALPVLAACHRNRAAESAVAGCEPVREALVRAADVGSLAGSHEVSFVIMSGAKQGTEVRGRLTLAPQADSLKRGPWSPAEQSLIGRFDVEPESLGAVRMGDPAAGDARQPGVALYVSGASDGTASVTARVGSESNRRGDAVYDAGYFALHLRSVHSNGFAGAWTSGNGMNEVAAGHFCARRL